jgi:hypothetical protein
MAKIVTLPKKMIGCFLFDGDWLGVDLISPHYLSVTSKSHFIESKQGNKIR